MPDLKNHAVQQQAMMEAFFFAYQAFTTKPDEMLARRGLGRVHHRVLFFIARYPGLSVKEALGLTAEGVRLEKALRREQSRLLQRCFEEAGGEAVSGWLAVNRTLARAHAGSRGEAATEAAD
ncbi:MarR family transcriptional regulator [Pseudomonas aeruginosa]|nr:MarR family transcriptional regulator [Pseudomonas aeruginosa]